jgi:hypothetical protein
MSIAASRMGAHFCSASHSQTHVTLLRLKRHSLRPAVKIFADYATEAFATGGLFAPPAQ